MALLDDIINARGQLEQRRNALSEAITTTDNRYSSANADQQDSWNGRWLGADNERLRQVNLLSQAVQDPSWTASLDREVNARKDAGFAQADYGHARAADTTKVTAARSGTAAGSWEGVVRRQSDQEMANTKAKVSQQVNELRAAGIQNLDVMGRQLLSQALAGPEESAGMGVSAQGTQAGYATDGMIDQNDERYRGLLADTLTNFVNNSVTPAVTMGFQSAKQWNQDQRDNYTDARDTGEYQGNFRDWANANGGTRSWWGF
jgi:hypothetical protein